MQHDDLPTEGSDDGSDQNWDDEAVPDPEPTGDEAVDAALAELTGVLRGEPDGEARVAGFDAAHRSLQDRLADVEG